MSLANYFSITLAFTIFYTILFLILAYRHLTRNKHVSSDINQVKKEVIQHISDQQKPLQDCFCVFSPEGFEDKAKAFIEKEQGCIEDVCQLIALNHTPALTMIPKQVGQLCELNLETVKEMTAQHKAEIKKQVEKAIAELEAERAVQVDQTQESDAQTSPTTNEESTPPQSTSETDTGQAAAVEGPSPEEVEEQMFQYEALIEQLRYEKSEYANRIDVLTTILKALQSSSKQWSKKEIEKPIEKLSQKELAGLFEVQLEESS